MIEVYKNEISKSLSILISVLFGFWSWLNVNTCCSNVLSEIISLCFQEVDKVLGNELVINEKL